MRETPLSPLAKKTIAHWFEHRHESPMAWMFARTTARDARLWLRLFGPAPSSSTRETP